MKRPLTRQSIGAAQLSLLPEPAFCPRFPLPHSAAVLALDELSTNKYKAQVFSRAARAKRGARRLRCRGVA